MNITQFVEHSLGRWRSQRSAHHLIFSHFEAVQSVIDIVPLSPDDEEVINLCNSYDIAPSLAVSPFGMSWEGESDWDDNAQVKGSCILVPVPDPIIPNRGKLLRDQGYAETIAAAGDYHITEDGTFVLLTSYDRAAAEEKIWFANPNLRFRVSLIKTSEGSGVVTASFSSEIRSLSDNKIDT
ncbi:phycobiliprotein lyase [Aphanothece sacrum]|uniref:Chromophore lyase CpcS/CpeS n=1 Tax=Aphanothece sacrum FPU1 TaxID=1920663 RepID=A0A401IIE5_APHSA|nr:phycobiliprotein lyase [Aphanothece sacrum]GBF81058.1 chromophore lyase CpcS/CpeS [Aphanothece sacrum FPU1]